MKKKKWELRKQKDAKGNLENKEECQNEDLQKSSTRWEGTTTTERLDEKKIEVKRKRRKRCRQRYKWI
jgi:hypothetical protein